MDIISNNILFFPLCNVAVLSWMSFPMTSKTILSGHFERITSSCINRQKWQFSKVAIQRVISCQMTSNIIKPLKWPF